MAPTASAPAIGRASSSAHRAAIRHFRFGVRGTVGANLPGRRFVVGIEGDGDWTDAERFRHFHSRELLRRRLSDPQHWLATVRGRAGYALDPVLVYGTGGAAFGDVRANFSNDPVSSARKAGDRRRRRRGRAGENWTAKAEYPLSIWATVCVWPTAPSSTLGRRPFPTSRSPSTKAGPRRAVITKFTFSSDVTGLQPPSRDDLSVPAG